MRTLCTPGSTQVSSLRLLGGGMVVVRSRSSHKPLSLITDISNEQQVSSLS